MGQIRVGLTVRLIVEALPESGDTGEIETWIPRADPLARTFPVKVRVNNPEYRLLPGMTARVEIPLHESQESIAVPRDALVRSSMGTLVFTVQDGVAQPIPVEPGPSHDGWIAVRGPLQAGDPVVVRGNEGLRPGQPVEVLDSPGPEASQ